MIDGEDNSQSFIKYVLRTYRPFEYNRVFSILYFLKHCICLLIVKYLLTLPLDVIDLLLVFLIKYRLFYYIWVIFVLFGSGIVQ